MAYNLKKSQSLPIIHFLVPIFLSLVFLPHAPDLPIALTRPVPPKFRDFALSPFRNKKANHPASPGVSPHRIKYPARPIKLFSAITPCHYTSYDNPKRFFSQLGHRFCYNQIN
jgi:hypothetical protein